MIIELTKDENLRKTIKRTKPPGVSLIDHFEAMSVWNFYQIGEEKAKFLKKLQKNHDHFDKVKELFEQFSDKFEKINTGLDWEIDNLIKTVNEMLKQQGRKLLEQDRNHTEKWRGPHPNLEHGSSTGNNFEIDVDKNTWYCFRCERGGDAVSLTYTKTVSPSLASFIASCVFV